ncbi:MAG TPA: hypothetical protein ENN90_03820 [Mariniphaga anaerophila]|uniref:Uncharacterized protein n=1 Tax=Mariniphaga anaerophila TaxID=1484053 RepID=A0A831PQ76_9BACT|nr:hypothetical protein [Mariniphaga anaerophila]
MNNGFAKSHSTGQAACGRRWQKKTDEQFKIICSLVFIMSIKSPVLSIDCKKKERLGNLYRKGKCFCTHA